MQNFRRPAEPADFAQKVQRYRDLAAAHFAVPLPEGGVRDTFDFVERWSQFKELFAAAQAGKCGYCEIIVIGTQWGDVEHFHPKGEVWALYDDPATWGQQTRWSTTITNRRHRVVCTQGYWWLAYDWTNYLLACMVCNQLWKGSHFPVREDPRCSPPTEGAAEHALLLNPFDDTRNPIEHLRFGEFGEVEPKNASVYGFESIRTYGLDREGLRSSRSEKARRAHFLVKELKENEDPDEIESILEDFKIMGADDVQHSGMVRSIFEDFSGMRWQDTDM